MFASKEAMATVAVKDIEAASRFYEHVLGLEPIPTREKGVRTYRAGGSKMLVYESQFAGTNQATSVTWPAGGDVDQIARDLAAKGVSFEHYEMAGMRLEGNVHVAGGMRVAWFKDPDGNIHALVSG